MGQCQAQYWRSFKLVVRKKKMGEANKIRGEVITERKTVSVIGDVTADGNKAQLCADLRGEGAKGLNLLIEMGLPGRGWVLLNEGKKKPG